MTEVTYGEVCQNLSDWFKKDNIDLSAEDIFDLDQNFPALMIHTLLEYMDKGLDSTTVSISDEYVAKKVFLTLERRGEIEKI